LRFVIDAGARPIDRDIKGRGLRLRSGFLSEESFKTFRAAGLAALSY
jgi:hypothetical protein